MNEFLKRLPSTNFRIFVGVSLAAGLVVYVLIAQTIQGAFELDGLLLDREYVDDLKDFILIVLGIDAVQFIGKRMTHKEGVGEPEPEDGSEDEPEHDGGAR